MLPKLMQESLIQNQDNLELLCSDRKQPGVEFFKGNEFYGHANILKHYAGLPDQYPLKVNIPHGCYIGHTNFWDEEVHSKLPSILCYGKQHTHAYNNHLRSLNSEKTIYTTAHPLVYLQEILKGNRTDISKPKKQGSIFFPSHSTANVTVLTDFETVAHELSNLDREYHPIAVCIYWKDYLLGHHLPFQKQGFSIVSAGHIYDPNFLVRFTQICRSYKYAISNSFTSALLYATHLGLFSIYWSPTDLQVIAPNKYILKHNLGYISLEYQEKFKAIFSTDNSNIRERIHIAQEVLGVDFLHSPQDLRSLLIEAEINYSNQREELLQFFIERHERELLQQAYVWFQSLELEEQVIILCIDWSSSQSELFDLLERLFMRVSQLYCNSQYSLLFLEHDLDHTSDSFDEIVQESLSSYLMTKLMNNQYLGIEDSDFSWTTLKLETLNTQQLQILASRCSFYLRTPLDNETLQATDLLAVLKAEDL